MKTITVNVATEDIAFGQKRDCNSCPVALAVRRHFPKALEVVIRSNMIDVNFETGHDPLQYRGITPAAVYDFIRAFDAGVVVSPFSFQLVLYPHDVYMPPSRAVL